MTNRTCPLAAARLSNSCAIGSYTSSTRMAVLLRKRRNRSAVLSLRALLGTLLAIRVKCTLRPLYSPIISKIRFVIWLSHQLSTNGSTRSSKILYRPGMAIVRIGYSGLVLCRNSTLSDVFRAFNPFPFAHLFSVGWLVFQDAQ